MPKRMNTVRINHAPAQQQSVAQSDRYRLSMRGLLRDTGATDAERVVSCAVHLWPLMIAFLAPLALFVPRVLWLAFRRRSPLVDDHCREAMNAQCTLLVLVLVPCIGWILLIPWSVLSVVSLLRAGIAGADAEFFRYPAILRPIR